MALNKIKINDTTTVNTGVVYDISKVTGQSYDSLSAALGTGGNNVPLEIREGGMSIRFVQTSDNKYVQYRLMADEWSTKFWDWQGVNDIINFANNDLVSSEGAALYALKNNEISLPAIVGKNLFNKNAGNLIKGYFVSVSSKKAETNTEWCYLPLYSLQAGRDYAVSGVNQNIHICFFNDNTFLSGTTTVGSTNVYFNVPANCNVVIISLPIAKLDTIQVEEGRQATTYEEYQIINNQEIKTTNIGYWVNGELHEDANYGYVQLDLKRGNILVVNTAAFNYNVFTKVNSDGTKSTLVAASGTLYGSKEYIHYSFEDETIIVSVSNDPARKRGSVQLINNRLVEGSGLQLIEKQIPLYGNRILNYNNQHVGEIIEGHSFTTDLIPCSIGDIFAFRMTAYMQSPYCIYDDSLNVLDTNYISNLREFNGAIFIKDQRAAFIRFSCNVLHDNTRVLQLQKPNVITNTDDYLNSQRVKGLKRYGYSISGEHIDDDGAIAQGTGFYRTFAIPCSNGDRFIYRGRGYRDCAYAIYNASGTLLYKFRFYNQDNIVLTEPIEITQCDNTNCYIIFSTNLLEDSYVYKYVNRSIAEMLHELEFLSKQNFELIEGSKLLTDGTVKNVIFSDGDLSQGWTTEPIPCKIGDQFFYQGFAYDSAYYAVYDSNDNVLYVDYHDMSSVPVDENGVAIPVKKYVTVMQADAAYIRFCSLGVSRMRFNDPNNVSRHSIYQYFVWKYVPENAKYRSIKDRTFIVDANGGGDFNTLWGAIVGTIGIDTKNNPIMIKVMPGRYSNDMTTGIGTPYCSKRYMSIIGEDKVNCIIESTNPYYNYMGISNDNSCLRLGTGNVYVANLTFKAVSDNPLNPNAYYSQSIPDYGYCAYTIHIDSDDHIDITDISTYDDTIIEIRNCSLYNDHAACFGIGMGPKQTIIIADCDLTSNITHSSDQEQSFSQCIIGVHDHSVPAGYSPSSPDTHLIVKNCILKTNIQKVINAISTFGVDQDLTFINNVIQNNGNTPLMEKGAHYTLTPLSFGNNSSELNYSN